MNYVAHDCRNSRLPEFIVMGKKKNDKIQNPDYCNNRWIDKDLTHATVNPPNWKYCRECAEKLGIDYDAQTPTSNLTEKEIEHKNKLRERMNKAREIKLQKIKSA